MNVYGSSGPESEQPAIVAGVSPPKPLMRARSLPWRTCSGTLSSAGSSEPELNVLRCHASVASTSSAPPLSFDDQRAAASVVRPQLFVAVDGWPYSAGLRLELGCAIKLSWPCCSGVAARLSLPIICVERDVAARTSSSTLSVT